MFDVKQSDKAMGGASNGGSSSFIGEPQQLPRRQHDQDHVFLHLVDF
jgi:hypothetical protein